MNRRHLLRSGVLLTVLVGAVVLTSVLESLAGPRRSLDGEDSLPAVTEDLAAVPLT